LNITECGRSEINLKINLKNMFVQLRVSCKITLACYGARMPLYLDEKSEGIRKLDILTRKGAIEYEINEKRNGLKEYCESSKANA